MLFEREHWLTRCYELPKYLRNLRNLIMIDINLSIYDCYLQWNIGKKRGNNMKKEQIKFRMWHLAIMEYILGVFMVNLLGSKKIIWKCNQIFSAILYKMTWVKLIKIFKLVANNSFVHVMNDSKNSLWYSATFILS